MKQSILAAIIILFIGFGASAQNVNIPDANFKAYLVGNTAINTNSDTEIQVSEASAFSGVISCNSSSISDMTGIEEFTALTELNCASNSLSNLDLSQNIALTELFCANNSLSSLDVSQNKALISLNFQTCTLTSIDLSQNTALTFLNCAYNSLSNLNISQNIALETLKSHNNPLTSLNLSQNVALTTLWCYYNSLTNLDVTSNTALTTLSCQNNSIVSLDLSQNINLDELSCYNNSLLSLDVSQNTAITSVQCGGNSIDNLDLSSNTALTFLVAYNNQLNTLNAANGNNANVTGFYASGNSNLNCITVDDVAYSNTNWTGFGYAFDAQTSFSTSCAMPTGVEEITNNINVSIYPNPATNQLNIETAAIIESIAIYNLLGKLVQIENTASFSVQDLENGAYLLKIRTSRGLVNKRFVKS
jgi:Leucine-rich repeat (LRR) protein